MLETTLNADISNIKDKQRTAYRKMVLNTELIPRANPQSQPLNDDLDINQANKLNQLTLMGFSPVSSRAALEIHGYQLVFKEL